MTAAKAMQPDHAVTVGELLRRLRNVSPEARVVVVVKDQEGTVIARRPALAVTADGELAIEIGA